MEETPPNDNLESKIKKEIMKSGFPLELFIFERCGRKNVGRMSNLRYIQDKELKEIDILTSFEEICFEEGKNPQYTSSNMIIECKKGSDKPWVFFQLPSNRKPGGVLYNLVYDSTFNDFFAHDAKPELLGQIRKNLKNHHYRNNKIPICISYCEPFKKENQSQIYPAIISVISYLKHLRKRRY